LINFGVYGGLIFTAFMAATVFPAQSEAIAAGFLAAGQYPTLLLLVVASARNVLCSFLNWLLERGIERFHHHR